MSGHGPSRAVLAAAAASYLGHGWPVAPGAWWSTQLHRYSCGRPRCHVTGPHPVDVPAMTARTGGGRCRSLASACVVGPGQVARWWGARQYALILPTSGPVSVIEGPADLVEALDVWLRAEGHAAPLSSAPTSPSGRTELFCARLRVGQEVWLAAASAGVLIHGDQSWVTLPPSAPRTRQAHWLRSPADCGWVLPPAALVAEGLRRALGAAPPRAGVAFAAGAVMV